MSDRRWCCALLLALSGCGGGRVGSGCPGCGATDGGSTNAPLSVTPATAMATADGGPVTQQFHAVSRTDGDVTAQAAWTVDAAYGTIANGLFTSAWPLSAGGAISITANYKGAIAGASLTLLDHPPDVVDPSADGTAPMSFGGPPSNDPTAAPILKYPFANTLLARNLGQMDLQWSGNPSDSLYRIHVVGDTIDATFYVGGARCTGGVQCSYSVPDSSWKAIALSAAGKAVNIQISGTAGAGMPVAGDGGTAISFSPEDVQGGLYYFSPTIRGIKRLPFGAATATDFIPAGNGTGCAGCHAVSRDGKKVAATFAGGDGYAGIVQGGNGQSYIAPVDMTRSSYAWNFATFNPDGSQMITNWAGKLELRDGQGKLIKQIPPNLYGAKEAVMPEWSPDGASIVFIGIPDEGFIGKDMALDPVIQAGDWILGNGGSVMVMPYNNADFGPARTVVPSVMLSEYHFYPSWSPDSQWIVFATGRYPGSSPTAGNNYVDTSGKCMSYDQDSARLRLVAATGGAVIELANATHQMDRTATWPKFAPFVQGDGQLVFITFSSKFAYGWVVPDGMLPQLWMAAIDLRKAQAELGNGDPSSPPFWLPFQDPTQANHSGIWTEQVACTGAGGGACPPEFTCEDGMCVPKVG